MNSVITKPRSGQIVYLAHSYHTKESLAVARLRRGKIVRDEFGDLAIRWDDSNPNYSPESIGYSQLCRNAEDAIALAIATRESQKTRIDAEIASLRAKL